MHGVLYALLFAVIVLPCVELLAGIALLIAFFERLSTAQERIEEWKDYARDLERKVLRLNGVITLPPG